MNLTSTASLSSAAADNADAGAPFLVIDDDPVFSDTLARALSRRGFAVDVARNRQQALALAEKTAFRYVTLDLHLAAGPAAGVTAPADSGLQLVAPLRAMLPRARILVLTGYASIATAVEAVKLGACHYLAKPSTTDDIEAAFERATGDVDVEVTGRPTSIKTLEWEHIHETLAATGFNISEAARRLGMHRRTLARKLEKQRIK